MLTKMKPHLQRRFGSDSSVDMGTLGFVSRGRFGDWLRCFGRLNRYTKNPTLIGMGSWSESARGLRVAGIGFVFVMEFILGISRLAG